MSKTRAGKLKVAHLVVVAPHKSGLYETARELAAALRGLDIDARIVDPSPSREEFPKFVEQAGKHGEEQAMRTYLKPRGEQDRETREPLPAPLSFAREADVLVSHSGLFRQSLIRTGLPVVEVIHGRPRACFLYERDGDQAIYTHYRNIAADPQRKAFVHFWPEFQDYWRLLLPAEKLHVVPAFVDLDAWSPGPAQYDFQGQGGSVNVVVADRTRNDKDVYHQLHSFALFAEEHPGSKIHICGGDGVSRGWSVLFDILRRRGALGQVLPTVIGLEHFYRSADMALTPHTIAVRTVREALACGCQLVAPTGNRYTPYTADQEKPAAFAEAMGRALADVRADPKGRSAANRQVAQEHFDPAAAAGKFAEILHGVAGR